jgi:hypothetical protein
MSPLATSTCSILSAAVSVFGFTLPLMKLTPKGAVFSLLSSLALFPVKTTTCQPDMLQTGADTCCFARAAVEP